MSDIFVLLLSMSVGGAVLVTIIFCLEKVFRGKFQWKWMYYVWLLAAARFLVPFGPALPARSQPVPPTAQVQAAFEPVRVPEAATGQVRNTTIISDPEPVTDPLVTADTETVASVAGYLWVVWLGGTLILFARKVTAAQSFEKYVRAGARPCGDTRLLDRVEYLSEKVGVSRPVDLAENPLVASPMVLGTLHPCIILPQLELPAEEFDLIVLHELVHCRRLDAVYKWIVQICVCIHWYNPLAHLMAAEVSRTGELSCDQAVLREKGWDAAPAYGKALVRAMAAAGTYNETTSTVELSANKKALKERLLAMQKTKSTGRKAIAAVALSAALGVLTACSPVCVLPQRQARLAAGREQQVPARGVVRQVEILADNVDLTIRETKADHSWASYNPDTSTVSISDDDDESTMHAAISGQGKVTLYVRDLSECSVHLDASDSSVVWNNVSEKEVFGTVDSCSVLLSFPDNYSGSLRLLADSSYVVLSAPDALSQAAVDVSEAARFETDDGYTSRGGSYTHPGSGGGTVSICAPESLVYLGGIPADGSEPEFADFSEAAAGRSRSGKADSPGLGDEIRSIISQELQDIADSFGSGESSSATGSSFAGVPGFAGLGTKIASLVEEILQGPVRNFLDSLAASI